MRAAGARGGLSANDERILAFVREHLGELAFHTAESLAQGAGVSAAAVVRFSRRLGFGSFRELREQARDELQNERPAEPPAGTSTLAWKIERDIASLQVLPELLKGPLEAAAAAIADARVTWFVANRRRTGSRSTRSGCCTRCATTSASSIRASPTRCAALDGGDAVVACTFRPYAKLTLAAAAPRARARRADDRHRGRTRARLRGRI